MQMKMKKWQILTILLWATIFLGIYMILYNGTFNGHWDIKTEEISRTWKPFSPIEILGISLIWFAIGVMFPFWVWLYTQIEED